MGAPRLFLDSAINEVEDGSRGSQRHLMHGLENILRFLASEVWNRENHCPDYEVITVVVKAVAALQIAHARVFYLNQLICKSSVWGHD